MMTHHTCTAYVPEICITEATVAKLVTDPLYDQNLSDDELLQLLEEEAAKPILPPSDWKLRAEQSLQRAKQLLQASPMGRGSL